MMKIIFVCLGNICRSPMAFAIAKDIVKKHNLDINVDSAGTSGYHDGEDMHKKTKEMLKKHNIDSSGFVSKKLTDFMCKTNDMIIVMDKSNKNNIIKTFGYQEKIHMMTDFAKELGYDEVPDPWYSGDFDETYTILSTAVKNLLLEK